MNDRGEIGFVPSNYMKKEAFTDKAGGNLTAAFGRGNSHSANSNGHSRDQVQE
jgi:hypothetical protein